ncbi:TatD family hydrolase [Mesomycoplasma ovipneumoniae]|uniref:TatD family hydrolase n=1 Tax=Mesomycoplasma ovipneumoniae TaxID=29562 RepID=UPI002964049A|nr:TatD family hydrolase [Mesomycoplasma ovipneumoniae]MDW2922073.1 TatD family hydrolase [Mesomycoplasma ovipneumoniae]
MYLKIEQFSPRHLNLLLNSIKKFNLEVNLKTKNGKTNVTNLDYFQNFENNHEFTIVDFDKNLDFSLAHFIISKKEQTFYLSLVFFSQLLDSNWINIIGEFILDFIKKHYKLGHFYLKIDQKSIFFKNFFAPWFQEENSSFLTFQIKEIEKYNFTDAHCHPFLEYFQNPKQEISKWFDDNIGLLFVVGTSWEDLKEIKPISSYSDKIYKIIGIHPNLIKTTDNYNNLSKYIDKNVVAIGEVGLDFYYENNPGQQEQINALLAQIEIAKSNNIAVMLHIRDKLGEFKAINEVLLIIDKFPEINFIFHNFSTNYEKFTEIVNKKNCYFSFSGVITFKKSVELRKIVSQTPISRILCETDTPYLSPEPNRQVWPNTSPQIENTYQTIANLKNLTKRQLSKIVYENALKIFKVKNAKNIA